MVILYVTPETPGGFAYEIHNDSADAAVVQAKILAEYVLEIENDKKEG